jgi:hypothetical protein
VLGLGLGQALALAYGCALCLPLRLASLALLAACLWPALAGLAGRGGPTVLGVDAAGRWWLRRGDERRQYARFGAQPLVLGDWVWLRFRGVRGRSYLFIDGPLAEPGAFRRLKVRLLLDPEGPAGGLSDRDRCNC